MIIRNQQVVLSSSQASNAALRQRVLGQHKKSTKTKGMPKPATLASYVGVFLLIVTLVAIGYQPPEKVDASVANAVSGPISSDGDQPSIDTIVMNKVAGDVAERANLPVTASIAERSTSLSVKSELAQTSDAAIVKPQIIQTKTRLGLVAYTSEKDETVQAVADKFGVSVDTIKWANNLTSDSVKRGKKLTIPPVDGVVYTVKQGDTVQSLAKRYTANEQRIVAINSLEINGIKKGQRIVIPDGVLPANQRPGYVPTGTTSRQLTYSRTFMAGSVGNRYAYGWCTWYAYEMRASSGHPVGSFWGNANTWAAAARGQGYKVDNTPSAGAVFQTTAGGYGHVGYIESVDWDKKTVTYSDMNGQAGWGRVGRDTISIGDAQARWIFIH